MIKNKKNVIIISIIFIIVIAVLCIFICTNTYKKTGSNNDYNIANNDNNIANNDNNSSNNDNSSFNNDYMCSAVLGKIGGHNPQIENSIFIPQIFAIDSKNDDMARKINNKIWDSTLANIPENISYRGCSCRFTLQSDDYLSCLISYDTINEPHNRSDEICVTINTTIGEVVYLNDLIEINDELVKKIKTSGFVKTDYDSDMQGSVNCIFSEKQLNLEDSQEILSRLNMCNMPYTKSNYICKPHFYLEKNRLYFVNLFYQNPRENYSVFYINLDDLTEFLKVKEW